MDQAQKPMLMGLSLLLALLIFLFIVSDLEGEMTLTIPVETVNVPTGLVVDPPPPSKAHVEVTGPRIMLFRFSLTQPKLSLDLRGAVPGTVTLHGLKNYIQLPPEVKLQGVVPAEVSMGLRARR
jgi:hypothetical protein